MKLQIGEHLTVEPIVDAVSAMDGKEAINSLFGFWAELQRRIPELAEEIFSFRRELANMFRTYGDGRLNHVADILESLESSDDLFGHAREPRKRRLESHERQRPYAFYVLGPLLDDLESEAVRKYIQKMGRKLGSATPILLQDLVTLYNDAIDDRTIFVTADITDTLIQQLALIVSIEPRFLDRIQIVSFDDGDFAPEPLSSFLASVPAVPESIITPLREFVLHQPSEGELFHGRITRVTGAGFFVEIVPNVTGFVHKDRLPSHVWDTAEQGDELIVEVIGVQKFGRISLSAKSVEYALQDGRKPLFGEMNVRLLESGQ